MNNEIIIPVAGFFLFAALFIGGGSSQNNEQANQQKVLEPQKQERSLARDFEASPDVVKGMNNIPVKKEKGQLSRAIEPNHRVANLNGLRLE